MVTSREGKPIMAVRISLVLVLVSSLLVASGSPATAESGETVTFRLTLRGAVNPADVFTLGIQASSGIIYSVGAMCAPVGPGNPAGVPVCAARSYDADLGGDVGVELTYTFARAPASSADPDEVLLRGTITITGSPQLVTLVYEYPGAPLPDTAVSVPGDSVEP